MSDEDPKTPAKRVRVPKVPPVPPGPPKEEKIVWINCRATPGCEGHHAAVAFVHGKSGQDSTTRYRCTTCKGSFHVRC